jgi:NADH-quinone oxidoreductase subunit C
MEAIWLRPVVEFLLHHLGLAHLSAITGDDTGHEIVLLYHFWDRGGLTLRIELPRDEPAIESIRDLIPGAVFYEREVVEMLGVRIGGYAEMGPLFLPDDWSDPPPMRRRDGSTP